MKMLRMILADDEPIITNGIQKLLNWKELGIDIIAAYENGQQALHGILTSEPDIAILDISMPHKTGIEILKEMRAAQCKTKVIFLSGFQDFEYVQAALRYGAEDYLLKPVKKNGLIAAIMKCVQLSGPFPAQSMEEARRASLPPDTYKKLVHEERTTYILVQIQPMGLEKRDEIQRQLIWFSAFGMIEENVERQGDGIAFQREDQTYLVLKGIGRAAAREKLLYLSQTIERDCGFQLGFVMGPTVSELQQVAASAVECAEMLGHFYFYECLDSPILETGLPVYSQEHTESGVRALQEALLTELFLQNRANTEAKIREYLMAVCCLSGSRSGTAVYYLLSCIRAAEERLNALGGRAAESKISDIVETLQSASNYQELSARFAECIGFYGDQVSAAMHKDETRDIILAKRYIDEHYAENITLETMAKQIHMNSFYFSSFFKKQTGRNFKDYLNQVRMNRALALLITTPKKTYEIAEEVGFKDYRYFSDLFSRFYGKTPAAYRKQQKERKQE
jgi:two-component system response regulator YesN